MGLSFEKPLKERIERSANITHENDNKKREKNYMPVMGIEPTDQTAYDCESSVLTTMLEGMLLFTASYDKYILNAHSKQINHTKSSAFRTVS